MNPCHARQNNPSDPFSLSLSVGALMRSVFVTEIGSVAATIYSLLFFLPETILSAVLPFAPGHKRMFRATCSLILDTGFITPTPSVP